MHAFGEALAVHDVQKAVVELAEDVEFRSPIVFKPYRGREAVAVILQAVSQVFHDFRYVRTIGGPADEAQALVFRARVGDREIEGCDFLQLDEQGKIKELVVMVRPISGALALGEAMRLTI